MADPLKSSPDTPAISCSVINPDGPSSPPLIDAKLADLLRIFCEVMHIFRWTYFPRPGATAYVLIRHKARSRQNHRLSKHPTRIAGVHVKEASTSNCLMLNIEDSDNETMPECVDRMAHSDSVGNCD
ncbi:uncharacterized protein LOC119766270 [Culex quinquefasciatus]|uniref:uncharacterized protein LOC119766270 n=1 Tax=Culex quinquefasciatus TaxID=7176 RepID=UPI0018E38944|nr:uncharacterized protein LOC119766270 [Culex quinquefasciatus]